MTLECVEKIIRKDMIDPTNGKALKESDIIVLQRVCVYVCMCVCVCVSLYVILCNCM